MHRASFGPVRCVEKAVTSPWKRLPYSNPWVGAALVAGLIAAYYGSSLRSEFVWDDRLTAAPAVDLGTVLTSRTGDYYRPAVMLSFAADRLLWGDSPAGFHLTSICCHLAAAWLLMSLARAAGLGPGPALASALVFAGHPVQTEAVTYISGRTDPLCAIFILLALLAWRRAGRATDRFAIASAIALLLALLSKEAAVLLPLVLLVRGSHPAASPPRPIIPALCAVVWLALWAGTGGPGLAPGGVLGRVAAVGTAALGYARLLVWPSGLHAERFVAVAGWQTMIALATWTTLAAVGTGLWLAARRVPAGMLWLALAAVTYAPVCGLLPVYPAIAHRALFVPEHFLYLPLLGLAPLVTGAIAGLWPPRLKAAAPIVLVLILVAWAVVVVDRNRDWRDEETLFRHTLQYEPPAARVWFDLGNLRLAAGDPGEAVTLYQAALARQRGDAAAHLNLGIALQRLGRLPEAEAHYEQAIALDPQHGEAYRALAALLAARGDSTAARRLWEHAERLER